MSKFQELRQAQLNASKAWYEFRERCWNYYFKLVHGLIAYCQIPDGGRVIYLRWNGQTGSDRLYSRPDDGGIYTLPGALEFDETEGFWHLGIQIRLSDAGSFPPQWVSFVLCISEKDEKPLIRIGIEGKGKVINVDNADERTEIYDRVVEQALKLFSEPRTPNKKAIGFEASPQQTTELS